MRRFDTYKVAGVVGRLARSAVHDEDIVFGRNEEVTSVNAGASSGRGGQGKNLALCVCIWQIESRRWVRALVR